VGYQKKAQPEEKKEDEECDEDEKKAK